MIEYDGETIARAVERRASELKWDPKRTLIVSRTCAWHATHPTARIEYEDGRPSDDMRRMIESVAKEADASATDVLASFGAAHSLLCDVVPGFRPVLFSAWDRGMENERRV